MSPALKGRKVFKDRLVLKAAGPNRPRGSAGASEVFFAGGGHVVDRTGLQVLASLTDMPAGNYHVSATVSNFVTHLPAAALSWTGNKRGWRVGYI
jgi:hypothetical protein